MEKQQAAGSIWNPNSWHWEMKNYTNVAKKLIEEKLLQLELKDGDVSITNTKVAFPKAEVIAVLIGRPRSTSGRANNTCSMNSTWRSASKPRAS